MKIVLIYYSRNGMNYFNGEIKEIKTGNTEVCVNYLKEITTMDIFKVKPVDDYDYDYHKCVEQAKAHHQSNNLIPLINQPINTEDYDLFIICGPNFCGTYPVPLLQYIQSLSIKGKKILPLITHEGSGFGRALTDLESIVEDCEFYKGITVAGSNVMNSKFTVQLWAKQYI